MLLLSLKNWSFDADLQNYSCRCQAKIENNVWIDEPLCIDVGLPALLLSAIEATAPNRWLRLQNGKKCRFLVCGCGDAECRGFSFVVEIWMKAG